MHGDGAALPATCTIRAATRADAPELARLYARLGYPMDAGLVADRFERFTEDGEMALVAAAGDRLVGLASLHRTPVLHRAGAVGRVTSLVVDEAARGTGVGRALMEAAEAWATERGCALMEVTSNRTRTS